ncbi:MAG TPA: CpaF family protein [Bdellovibrionota bacterium]|nr:CpaF family protein [Bdellovibrionota bacterium]
MSSTIPQEIRDRARAFLHEHLLEIIDLRRADYTQLRGASLRRKVENLVRQCLEKMHQDYRLADDAALVQDIVDEAVGLGPLENLLRDPSVTEVMVNGRTAIYVERGGKIERTPFQFISDSSLRSVIDRIVSPLGRRIDESSPMVDARLADGSRVNAVIPPLALNGPTITIRKFSKVPLSVSRLIEFGSLTDQAASFLSESVRIRKNILIAGGTGSGKTTLLNALSGFIPRHERIVTIEDAAELKLPQDHVVSLETRPANVEGKGEVAIRDLVRNALRMRPDRIVVGECRGGEALDMLQAMNTGHDGSLTTAHANSPRDALLRLETMVLMAGFDLPLRAIREQIASALDLIVFQARLADGTRRVTHVTEVCGAEEGTILTQDLFLRQHGDTTLRCTGRVPRFLGLVGSNDREIFLKILDPLGKAA